MSQFISQPAPDVVDNLTTNDSTKALSAAQGKALNDKITKVSIPVTLETNVVNIDSRTKCEKFGNILILYIVLNTTLVSGNKKIGSIPSQYAPISIPVTTIYNGFAKNWTTSYITQNGDIYINLDSAAGQYIGEIAWMV